MGATSVTGVGPGESGQLTGPGINLAIAAIQRQLREMPIIIFASSGETVDVGGGNYEYEFELDSPSENDADSYAYFATAEGEHTAFITNVTDDGDGKLLTVTVGSDAVTTIWLAIVRKGFWNA